MKILNDVLNTLQADRRAKVEARATQLIAEEMTLRDLRKARAQTQERMAEVLAHYGHEGGEGQAFGGADA